MTNLVEKERDLITAQAMIHLVNLCHGASKAAGWWVGKDGKDIRENPLTFSNKLMLTVTELAEACEGDRKKCMDTHLPDRLMTEVELADALIRILDLAGAYNLDIGGALIEKMRYNLTRQDHSKAAREAVGGKAY